MATTVTAATPVPTVVADPLAVNDPEEDRRRPLPREGQLRTLDGSLVDVKRVRVTIMATENDKEDVKLGLNGHNMSVK